MITDETKKTQAVKIITAQISKLPADTPCDYGTVGALRKMTKREGEAENLARYFVENMYKVEFPVTLYETWTDEQKRWRKHGRA